MSNNGTAFFGCKLSAQTKDYKLMWCLRSDAPSVNEAYNVNGHRSVCEAAVGVVNNCHNTCVIPQTKEKVYKKSCSESKGKAYAVYDKLFTYDDAEAEVKIGCEY